jgi:hypothetical protein
MHAWRACGCRQRSGFALRAVVIMRGCRDLTCTCAARRCDRRRPRVARSAWPAPSVNAAPGSGTAASGGAGIAASGITGACRANSPGTSLPWMGKRPGSAAVSSKAGPEPGPAFVAPPRGGQLPPNHATAGTLPLWLTKLDPLPPSRAPAGAGAAAADEPAPGGLKSGLPSAAGTCCATPAVAASRRVLRLTLRQMVGTGMHWPDSQ